MVSLSNHNHLKGSVQKSVYFKNNEIKFSFERSLNFTLDLPSQDFLGNANIGFF